MASITILFLKHRLSVFSTGGLLVWILLTSAVLAGCIKKQLLPEQGPQQNNNNINNPQLIQLDNREVSNGNSRQLVWRDEFDGPTVNPEKWFFEAGDGSQYGIPGWGNNELQWYLPDNARIENGVLIIDVKQDQISNHNNTWAYTSARLNTRDRFAFRYGRIEARIKLPAGQGVWPAFWLLPQQDKYGTWAASGEIDVMEAVNLQPDSSQEILGSIHYGDLWPDNIYTTERHMITGATEAFHVYALEWDAKELRWYVDGHQYAVQNKWSTTGGDYPAPFDQYFYVLLNVAVGGNLPGSPNPDTQFPVKMEVDYVRVYSGSAP